MRPFALFAAHNNIRIAEDLHVMRQRGLSYLQIIEQYTRTFLSALQEFQYPYTVFVAERLENSGGSFFVRMQTVHLP